MSRRKTTQCVPEPDAVPMLAAAIILEQQWQRVLMFMNIAAPSAATPLRVTLKVYLARALRSVDASVSTAAGWRPPSFMGAATMETAPALCSAAQSWKCARLPRYAKGGRLGLQEGSQCGK